MSLEAAFRAYVLAGAGLEPLIDDRLYPVTLPRAPEYPCARYTVISKVRDQAFGSLTGLCMARIQVDIFSPQYDVAKEVMNLIRVRLVGSESTPPPWPSTMGTPAVEVQAVFIDGEGDGYEGADDGFDAGTDGPVGVYSSSADFLIWHKEPAPV